MTLKLLLVDDEPLARALLRSLADRDPDLEVVGESADGRDALRDIERERPDIIFLDVQMPRLSGVEVAEKLQADQRRSHVVFVTAHDDYAVRAFELHALDYLVKPIQKARFAECISRAKQVLRTGALSSLSERVLALTKDYHSPPQRMSNDAESGILIRTGDRVDWIQPEQIEWVEAANQYVYVHTPEGTFTLSESLGAFLRRASHPDLVRVHRSAAINTVRIERVVRKSNGTHAIQLASGTEVKLSRRRRDLVPTLLRMARRAPG